MINSSAPTLVNAEIAFPGPRQLVEIYQMLLLTGTELPVYVQLMRLYFSFQIETFERLTVGRMKNLPNCLSFTLLKWFDSLRSCANLC